MIAIASTVIYPLPSGKGCAHCAEVIRSLLVTFLQKSDMHYPPHMNLTQIVALCYYVISVSYYVVGEYNVMDYKMDWHTFWSDVRQARAKFRISQKTAGSRYGVGGSAFGQWERKHRAMLGGKFMDMCFIFDLNPYAYYAPKSAPEWKQEKLIAVSHDAQEWPQDFEIPEWVEQQDGWDEEINILRDQQFLDDAEVY